MSQKVSRIRVEDDLIQLKTDSIGVQSAAKSSRSRFICLTNIPTPYRLHFFNSLSAELERRGWSFEVWFMSTSEPGRHWHFKPEEFKFRHRFLRGMSFNLPGGVFHLNSGIGSLLRKAQPAIILLAGSWALPTNVITTLQSKVLSNLTLLFWSESHFKSIKYGNWPVNKLRTLLLLGYDGFVVPGRLALAYVRNFAPNRPVYMLANIVNESVFKDKVFQYRVDKHGLRDNFGIPEHKRILLLPARLHTEKGVVPFLTTVSSLSRSALQGFSVLVAGDGPLRGELESWVDQHTHTDVRLVGHVDENEMAKLYAVADSFVLPSLSDPNPLAVIEALWAGLPLILSDRVGNHPETLVPGENGWLFDPESPGATRKVLENWVDASTRDLDLQGKASARLAEERFRTERVVNNFLDQVTSQTLRSA